MEVSVVLVEEVMEVMMRVMENQRLDEEGEVVMVVSLFLHHSPLRHLRPLQFIEELTADIDVQKGTVILCRCQMEVV